LKTHLFFSQKVKCQGHESPVSHNLQQISSDGHTGVDPRTLVSAGFFYS